MTQQIHPSRARGLAWVEAQLDRLPVFWATAISLIVIMLPTVVLFASLIAVL
jgi:hypothetical protein